METVIFFPPAPPELSLGSIHGNVMNAFFVAVRQQPHGGILSEFSRVLKPQQPFLSILGYTFTDQQHEADFVLSDPLTLLCGEAIPARRFCQIFRADPLSGRITDAKRTLRVNASESAGAQEFLFVLWILERI